MSAPTRFSGGSRASFNSTPWSLVWRARDGDSQAVANALEELCRSYWCPIYAFLRRDGYTSADAQDLTQEFLARLIHREWLVHLKHEEGKFRNFLLTFLKHFLSDERDRARAQKRGGRAIIIALDGLEAEERDALGLSQGLTPEQVFERRLAQQVMDRANARLEAEYMANGRAALFAELRKMEPGKHTPEGYAVIGARLGLSEGAVKSARHRMLQRHAALLRAEIARLVSDPTEVEAEIAYLMDVLQR